MTKKLKGFSMVLIALMILSLSITGCQTRPADATPNDTTPDSLQVYDASTTEETLQESNMGDDENNAGYETQSPAETDTVKNPDAGQKPTTGNSSKTPDKATDNSKAGTTTKPNAPESTTKPNNNSGSSTKTQNSSGNSSSEFTIDDYMTMNDSLENFTAFVNRRTDFSEDEKKEIINARASQLDITDKLMAEYKKILTEDEMNAYLVQPIGEALEAGMVPANDNYDEALKKIDKAKSSDTEIARLSKELDKVKGGILKTFVDKAQKEKSKLLGF